MDRQKLRDTQSWIQDELNRSASFLAHFPTFLDPIKQKQPLSDGCFDKIYRNLRDFLKICEIFLHNFEMFHVEHFKAEIFLSLRTVWDIYPEFY